VRAERGGFEVDLDDGGVLAHQRPVPHRPHVQGAAPADDEVGGLDQLGGQRGGEPAADVEVERVPAKQPAGDGRRRQQRPRPLPQLPQLAPGQPGAAPGDEDRAPRARQRVRQRRHLRPLREGRRRRKRRLRLEGVRRDLRLHVKREVHQDRATLGQGGPAGALEVGSRRFRGADALGNGPDRGGER
jgi:hypothetical protein